MSASMAGRAFLCGATCVGLQELQKFKRAPRKYAFPAMPVMCDSSSSSKPLCPSLHLPRAAFIRKNPNPVASEYDLGDSIVGEGAYSIVVTGKNKHTGIERAIKIVRKSTTDDEAFEVEIESLIALDHPHIVKILEYFNEGDNYYIVFEMIDGPDLVQYIIRRAMSLQSFVPEEELSIILRQVLKAILSCHERGITHRDVKLENFMISGKEMTVKMIDLGLAATTSHPVSSGNAVIGTYRYMAPEIYFSDGGYDKAVDMWALGVGFYTMLTLGMILPDGKEDVRNILKDKKKLEDMLKKDKTLQQRKISKDARDFLYRCLAYDPSKRITAEEALQHPFIKNSCNLRLNRVTTRWISDEVLAKMEAFASASPLERIARLAIAHTISQRPDKELMEVRLMFRTLNTTGNGKLSLAETQSGLQRGGFKLPPNFAELFAVCSSSGDETLNFNEFMACNLPDCFVNEQLCTSVFHLLDRDGDGLLGAEDIKAMYAAAGGKGAEVSEDIVFKATGKTSLTPAQFCKFVLGSE